MRLLGITPKILVTSVALHATALVTVGYLHPSNQLYANRGASSAVGLRLVETGGQNSATGTPVTDTKSKLLVAARQPKRHVSASTKVSNRQAPSKPDASPVTPAQVPLDSSEGSSSASLDAAGDGFEPTSGLKLVASSIIMPPYTDDARIKHFEGTLVVEVATDEDGRVTEAKLKNPSGLDLDAGVLAAARRAIYDPPLGADGSKTTGRARLKFRFHLEPDQI